MSPPTLKQLLAQGRAALGKRGLPSPGLDAELLCMAALGLRRPQLYTRAGQVPPRAARLRYRRLVRRRARGVPVAYLLGRKEFMGLEFYVDRRVLIPRPETELLVEQALARLGPRGLRGLRGPRGLRGLRGPRGPRPPRVLDVGTGSGCVAVAVACHCPQARVWAVDLSRAALAVARRNVQALAPGKVRLAQSDLFAKIPNRPCWDLILSNPPYLTDGDYAGLLPGLRYEPALALRAGPEGLEFYRRLGPEARTRLAPGGALLVETGAGQGAAVAALLARAGFVNPQVHRDLAGLDRLVTGERGNY